MAEGKLLIKEPDLFARWDLQVDDPENISPPFLTAYIERRILIEPSASASGFTVLQKVAEIFVAENNTADSHERPKKHFSSVIAKYAAKTGYDLETPPYMANDWKWNFRNDSNEDNLQNCLLAAAAFTGSFECCLLTAAAFTNNVALIRRVFEDGLGFFTDDLKPGPHDRNSHRGPYMFLGCPYEAAIYSGNYEALDALLSLGPLKLRPGIQELNESNCLEHLLLYSARSANVKMVRHILITYWQDGCPVLKRSQHVPDPVELFFPPTPSVEILQIFEQANMKTLAQLKDTNPHLANSFRKGVLQSGWLEMAQHLYSVVYRPEHKWNGSCWAPYDRYGLQGMIERFQEWRFPYTLQKPCSPNLALQQNEKQSVVSKLEHLLQRSVRSQHALLYAAMSGNVRHAETLLTNQTHPLSKTGKELTASALLVAVKRENTAMVRFLMDKWAHLYNDTTGVELVECAVKEGLESMLDLLAEYGVKREDGLE